MTATMNHAPRRIGRSYQDFTKDDVDRADALDFGEDTRAPAQPTRRIELRTVVSYRGRQIEIVAEGFDLDALCDMLDKRVGPPQVTQAAPQASAPICPVHQGRAMKPMQRPDKAGNTHMCTAKVGDSGWCDQRA